jgi:hypothetical protein
MSSADPLLIASEKGLTARCGSVFLYPPDDPLGYARRRASSAAVPPRTLVFVPSVGLGYGLAELLLRLPEDSSILCMEADQRIMALASSVGLPSHPRLTVVRADSESAAAQTLARMGTGRFRRVMSVPLSAGYRLNPVLYEGVRRILETEIRTYWCNRITLIGMGSLFVRNLFDNLPLLPRSRDAGGLRTEKPVVVCGAGPSLEDCLPMLLKLRGRFLLAAVDTALPALASHSLTPDLIVTMEAQHANLADFLPFRDPRIPLVCDLSACPAVPRLCSGGLYFFSSAFAPIPLFDRLRNAGLLPFPIPPLGSVGVAAAYAAARMTDKEIMLAGLDFSYPGSRTHARGTPGHLALISASTRLRSAEQGAFSAFLARPRIMERDKNGGRVPTDSVLRSYRDQLERSMTAHAGSVIDIGPTGLALGVRHVGLDEAEEILADHPEKGAEPGLGAGRALEGDACEFLRAEAGALKDAEDAAVRAMSADADAAGIEALRAVDYAYIHFPDYPEPGTGLEKSFLARARIAFMYYAERLGRITPPNS